MTELSLICFWLGFGIGAWATNKHVKDPTYFRTRLARLFNRD